MLTSVHPLLSNCATSVRSKELERCWVSSRSHNNNGVLKCAEVFESLYGLSNRRVLLTNCHVDALNTLSLLIKDCVNRNSGLTGFAVTNDELALSTSNWGHGVNGLDTSLEWLSYWLATCDSWGLDFHTTLLRVNEWSLAVDWLSECVHHATKQCVTYWHRKNAASGANNLLFFDAVNGSKNYSTNGLFIEVHCESECSVLELKQLVNHC